MKILWSSNAPWARTGYGAQTALFVPRLQAAGHQLAIQAWYGLEGGVLNWSGVPVYPKAFHGYGQDVLGAHAAHFGAQIAITLIDAWVMEPRMYGGSVKWCPWFPVDMTPIPPPVLEKAAQAFQPLVYSRFAEALCREAGLDVRYIPHGVDTAKFSAGDMDAARARLKWPNDRWIVSMVSANKGTPSRKALPESIQAFADLHKRHPDAMLYLHSHAGQEMQGVNLRELVEFYGLRDAVKFADQYQLIVGFPDDYMADVYRSSNVLLAASMGEGFGVPILEAQACGCPVITGGWTSMPELTWHGITIDPADAHKFWTPLGAFQYLPSQAALADALDYVYRNGYSRVTPPQVADFDADNVVSKYWLPALAEIEARLPQKAQAVTA